VCGLKRVVVSVRLKKKVKVRLPRVYVDVTTIKLGTLHTFSKPSTEKDLSDRSHTHHGRVCVQQIATPLSTQHARPCSANIFKAAGVGCGMS
jgi:hypothetical protein